MARKTRREKKKTRRRIVILLIVVVFCFIIAVAWYQIQMRSGGSKEAQDYFEVVSAGVDSGEVVDNETWKLTGISLTFKAVGGDAHDVVIQSWAGSDPIEVGDMKKDAPRTVFLTSSSGYRTIKEADGFPVTIRIYCQEASGKFKFYLSD